jgi:hypothetical protein
MWRPVLMRDGFLMLLVLACTWGLPSAQAQEIEPVGSPKKASQAEIVERQYSHVLGKWQFSAAILVETATSGEDKERVANLRKALKRSRELQLDVQFIRQMDILKNLEGKKLDDLSNAIKKAKSIHNDLREMQSILQSVSPAAEEERELLLVRKELVKDENRPIKRKLQQKITQLQERALAKTLPSLLPRWEKIRNEQAVIQKKLMRFSPPKGPNLEKGLSRQLRVESIICSNLQRTLISDLNLSLQRVEFLDPTFPLWKELLELREDMRMLQVLLDKAELKATNQEVVKAILTRWDNQLLPLGRKTLQELPAMKEPNFLINRSIFEELSRVMELQETLVTDLEDQFGKVLEELLNAPIK